ncbi:hypothetical protein GCM10023340_38280 [Nocardioides marinquilinus]|uniref:Secreted protein n=1 Tax=Nocardioides marinquilinus TaxID=1210400 RepID=A0ABP9PYZ3_9ACTN
MTNPTARRATTLVAAVAGALALSAVPASADVPEGWPQSDPVDPWFVIGVLVVVPVVLALVIAAFVYVPAMVRGERVAPGGPQGEDQWLGGPRRTAGELDAPDHGAPADAELDTTGGAGGRW